MSICTEETKIAVIGRYKNFDDYISSGYDYLPKVPTHWRVLRNRQLFQFKKRIVGKLVDKYQVLSLTLNGVIPRDIESGKGKMPAEFDSYQIVKPGNLVFCLFDIDETPRTIGISSHEGMVTGAYKVAEVVKEHSSEFVYYYYLHLDEFKGLKPFYTGLRKVVRPETFLGLYIPVPPLEEQRTIAAFLDYETARIDKLIAKQQRLMELLKEKRQAMISHAVTKGLNPDAPMKDSGVEWLSKVPEHWRIPKLMLMTTRIGDGLHSTPEYEDGTGYYFVNGNNLSGGAIVLGPTSKEVPESEYHKHHIKLDETTLLISINGTIGNLAVYENEAIILGKSACYIKCGPHLNRLFLMNYLRSNEIRHYFETEVTGTTIFNLSLNSIRQMKVNIPPVKEQNDIVRYCAKQDKLFDKLTDKSSQIIWLLQERRTALISAAVTGKIDLRGWVAPTEEVSNG
ncbi:TPA: restriction endonuclease subunit S [Klebsiella pneumoniae]